MVDYLQKPESFSWVSRDRVNTIWQGVRDHIYSLVMGAAACDHHFLLERSVVGLLRLAIHLMRREDMSPVVSPHILSKNLT
jgi:brefeldin A-resistance guanine nucleotide exchange factor 1